MDAFTKFLWVVAIVLAVGSLVKDRKRTFAAMKQSQGMMKSMIGEIVAIIFLIGLLLTFVPPTTITSYLSSSSNLVATVAAAIVGSITLIPAFVAFPLAGSIVNMGASVVPAVAFLTTLTMVGVVTFPLEKKEFGLKFAAARNLLSFVAAVIIALCMGVLLK